MARTVRIVRAREFVSVAPDGHLDLEASEKLLREVAGVLEQSAAYDILLDTRDANSALSATDLWFLADKLVRYPRMRDCKVALLCLPARLDYARFYALRAEATGVDVQACLSYEDAMTWLLELD